MPVDFYYAPWSPPCRTVQFVAALINVQLNPILTTPGKGDTQKPEYKNMNPQHTIPTIVDNGFVVSESRAICRYLVEKYAVEIGYYSRNQLYPMDLQKKTMIDQRLDFDLGTLYRRTSDYFGPALVSGEFGTAALPKLKAALEILEAYLTKSKWLVGSKVTLADIPAIVTVSSLEAVGFNLKEYPHVVKWLNTAQGTIPYYNEINYKGAIHFREFIFNKMQEAKKNSTASTTVST